jgi:hypothetical protein
MDSPDIVTPDKFASLDPKRCPLLIMPLTRMLSDEDIAHLERFVRDGGTLLADYAPGVVDGYGALLKKSNISKLFGVEIASAAAPGVGELYFGNLRLASAIPGQPVKLLGKAQSAGALKRTVQGMMLGGIRMAPSVKTVAPAVIVNRYGKGKTIYLNAILPAYDSSTEEKSASLRTMARALLELAGADVAVAARREEQLAMCRNIGVDHTVNIAEKDLRKSLLEWSGDGVGFILDAAGSSEMLIAASGALAYAGAVCAYAGGNGIVENFSKLDLPVSWKIISSPPREDSAHEHLIALARDKKIPFHHFYTGVMPLEDIADGFEKIFAKKQGKMVFLMHTSV